MKYFIFVLLFTGFLHAENIYLTNGKVLKNVEIVKKDAEYIIVSIIDKNYKIKYSLIEKIEYDNLWKDVFEPPRKTVRPNAKLWPVSIISGVLAWDYYNQWQDIDAFSGAKLTGIKNKKMYFSLACFAVTIINLAIVLDEVEITQKGQGVELTYHF